MSLKYKHMKMIVVPFIGLVIATGWITTSGMAAENSAGIQANGTANAVIRQIKPIGDLSTPNSNIRAQDVFDVVGTLNAVDGNQVVINDKEYTIASGVSASGISTSYEVGLNLNGAGEVVALEIISTEPH